jgi:hypothetical protein
MLGNEFTLDSDGYFKLQGMGCGAADQVRIGDKSGIWIDKYIEHTIESLKNHEPVFRAACDDTCMLCNYATAHFCVNTLKSINAFFYVEEKYHCFAARWSFALYTALMRVLSNPGRQDTDVYEIFYEVSNATPGQYDDMYDFVKVDGKYYEAVLQMTLKNKERCCES